MGELESLLLVLALIYLSECLVWVRRGALAFGTWRGKHFGILHPGAILANQRGGLLLANPLLVHATARAIRIRKLGSLAARPGERSGE